MDPLIPRPWVTAIAVGLVILLGVNLYFDYSSTDYNGWQFTYAICALIASILGFPIGFAAYRRNRDDRPDREDP